MFLKTMVDIGKEPIISVDWNCENYSGSEKLSEITIANNNSFTREELEPLLLENKRKYEPKEGYIACSYCGEQKLPADIYYTTIISPNWKDNNFTSPPRPYCKDKPCATYDQMAHEG
mgnify:CR=1 FL=1